MEVINYKLRNRFLYFKFFEFVVFLEKNLRVKNDCSLYLIILVDLNIGEQQKVYLVNLKVVGVYLKGKYRILEFYRKIVFLFVKDVLFIRIL